MIIDADDYLAHYGIIRKSGRYPWGSGGDKTTYNGGFLDVVAQLKSQGFTDSEIAKGFDTTTTKLRAAKSIETNRLKQEKIRRAQQLADKGVSNSAIGRQMGINESSVRSLLAPGQQERADNLQTIASMLEKNVNDKDYIQIGSGVENQLGISSTKLNTAVAILEEKGYQKISVQEDQLGSKNKTTVKVLAKPGTTYRDVVANKDKIRLIGEQSDDNGRSYQKFKPPLNVDPKRVKVRYSEKNAKGEEIGGGLADGVIFVRPGKEDLDIGGASYAQVRIAVGGTHYLKGMAIYKDGLPPGIDLEFNTNKTSTGKKLDAMKKMQTKPDGSVDLENPFGSQIRRQILTADGEKPTSAMNIVNEEGTWENWSNSISTQVLSKQKPTLAKQQLDLTYERQKMDLEDIKKLTNPAVRRKLLEAYADGVDSSAVHLQAAALPRQGTHVLLPVEKLKPTEVYAPNYKDGETVVLIRYPHGGKFEIPELTVNNRNKDAQKLIGKQARDAVGINPRVAERLSGADFDGDTVVVVPNSRDNPNRIQNEPALKALKGFDPQREFKGYEGMPKMTPRTKGTQMGLVSNLITDMTIKGASNDELARAVKHSMVVIDAEKHNLDYKASAQKHGIPALYKKYQGRTQGGASTLISRATSQTTVAATKPRSMKDGGPIDRKTGELRTTPITFVDRDGNERTKTARVDKLSATTDAYTLVSVPGTKIESVYADHSNRLKGLANEARKEVAAFKPPLINKSAKEAFKPEVESLKAKLNIARSNKPLERQAQIFANAIVAKQLEANPLMDPADLKKIKTQALAASRDRTGALKQKIVPTPEEWAAIQAGAVSQNQLQQILDNADLDKVRELATPRSRAAITPVKRRRAQQMLKAGYTQAEVATQLGVSVGTLKNIIDEA